jgi:hypothetical protein
LITVRASLLASSNAQIDENSIKIKVDGKDVTSLVKFNRISQSEYTLIYQSEQEYESGLHKVEVSFSDTNNLEAQKSWTFNISTDQKDPNKFYIFGYGISKTVVYVVVGGLLLILLALIVPLILVKIWKEDKETVEEDDTLTPPTPTDTVSKMVNEPTVNQVSDVIEPTNTTFSKLEKPPTTTEPVESIEPRMSEPTPPKEKAGGEIKKKIIEAKKKKAKEEQGLQQNSSDDTASNTTVESNTDIPEPVDIPDPDEDLKLLYEKINKEKEQEKEDSNNTKQPKE